MTTTAVVDELKASGFANAGAVALTAEESQELTRLATEVHNAMPSECLHYLGAVPQSNGLFRIAPKGAPTAAERSFSLGLEHLEGTVPGSGKLRGSIALLRLIMSGYRTVSRLVRAAGGAQGKAK